MRKLALATTVLALVATTSLARAQDRLDHVNLRLSWIASGEYVMYPYGIKRDRKSVV